MNNLVLPSPAKINLFLHINNRRLDGYHELQTLFQFLDLSDTMTFSLLDSDTLDFSCTDNDITNQDNLVVKAYELLLPYLAKKNLRKDAPSVGKGVAIHLDKKLPIGGGIGGGSSNAATTLHALNTLWNLGLTTETLMSLGLQLGADVPVFINGEATFAEGVGEIFKPAQPEEKWVLIVHPECHVSTAKVFQDPDLKRNTTKISIDNYHFETTHNDCETLVKKQYPAVASAINALLEYAPSTRLTGTGACVFALFDDEDTAKQTLRQLPKSFKGFVSKGLNQSPLLSALKIVATQTEK